MDKEKTNRDMYIKVQPSLYNQFKEVCNHNFKSISVVIRELMLKYIQENKINDKI